MTSVSVSRLDPGEGENSSIRRLGSDVALVFTKHWRVKNQPKRVASRIIFFPWSNGRMSDSRPRSVSSLEAANNNSVRVSVSVLRATSRAALPEEGLSS